MKKRSIVYQSNPIPVRLSAEQDKLLTAYQAKTGLGKSFIIRRCITYAMSKFDNGGMNILTLK
ncbi:MAG: hypothetical protein LBH01_02330 [Verrucomicrobiales bacterium]|jgi:hypothetical protein|nr:hypothetical protein [Verrucomicrobiales bacterium]